MPRTLLLTLCSALASVAHAAAPTLESARLKVTFRDDLAGIASVVDKATGRDYAAQPEKPIGLYRIIVGGRPWKTVVLHTPDAARRRVVTHDGGLDLVYDHEGDFPLTVTCRVRAAPGKPMLRWSFRVDSATGAPVRSVEFPRIPCPTRLGADAADDAIAWPVHEGVLLCHPERHVRGPRGPADAYPGRASMQFMYFLDPAGGLYVAAHDAGGNPKVARLSRIGDRFVLAWEHVFPVAKRQVTERDYDVVWTAGDGSWQAGAALYRAWAQQQPFAAKKIGERDVAPWLTQAVVFLNYGAQSKDRFATVDAAERTLAAYRQFLGVPLVACAFGWEKHGTWIGPDYFPPRPSEDFYIQLARRLAAKGDHMQVFTSGFRWGVRKPQREARDKTAPRLYTAYDGTADFERRGRAAVALGVDRKPVFNKPPWADNYTLCVGSQVARDLLGDAFRRIYGWGVAGVDLDQNLGGAAAACYSPDHGHPPGSGRWQHEAMAGFLRTVRAQAKAEHPDAFIGIEEPCEATIPWIDIVHGRAFTDTHWPVVGPGAVSIPLYIFVYHEQQLNYAGWIDGGFSPFGDVRWGMGRAFLFGMQLGVRINDRDVFANTQQPPPELRMLRRAAQLLHKTRDWLLLGRMLADPKIAGSPVIEAGTVVRKGRRTLPIAWPVVQATAWRRANGDVLYAVANLSDGAQAISLEAAPHGMKSARLTRITPEGEGQINDSAALPQRLDLPLKPWELLCILQQPAGE
ncbi:hypothetical protein HQ576_20870 [bacterium]|nr:hypothetical protein [bacterium]